MAKAKLTVFDQDTGIFTVVGIGVSKRALASFEGYGVVVDRHITALDQYVRANVEVDSIGAGRLNRGVRRIDVKVEYFDIVALIIVARPEAGVMQTYVLHLHIVAMPNKNQPGPRHLQVRAVGVLFTALPKCLPVVQSIPIDGTLA